MYRHILIATDGSELAKKGVGHGLGLAKALGVKATIVLITKPFPLEGVTDFTGWVPGKNDKLRYEASQKEFIDSVFGVARKLADDAGIEAEYINLYNHSAAEGILDAAKTHDCDAIVMASHGRRGLGRLLLGSQTAEVVQNATVPVLVVR